MIGYLKGKITNKVGDEFILVTLDGVGWAVHLQDGVFLETEDIVEIYVHTQFKENEITLWGFKEVDQLRMFRLLITVSGVGPKSAFNILSEKGIKNITDAILLNDESKVRASGVGKKTAQKIILELKDRLDSFANYSNTSTSNTLFNTMSKNSEVIEALESLGYKQYDIQKAFNYIKEHNIAYNETDKLEDKIKILLKYL